MLASKITTSSLLRYNQLLQTCTIFSSHRHSNFHPLRYGYSNSLPKGSQFSNFMGLQKQLESVHKEELKIQKNEVFSNSFMIVIALVVLGGSLFIYFYDKNSHLLLSLKAIKLKSNLFTSAKHKPDILREGLVAILEFLKATPYDYLAVIKQLNYLSKDLRGYPQLLQLANECYSLIAKRNFKAGQSRELVQAISNLVESMILSRQKVGEDLIKLLLRKGEIQQAYLGLVCLEKMGIGQVDWISDQAFKAEVLQNLSTKKNKDQQYYAEVFAKREQEQYPQIAFKRSQENRWLSYIEAKLHISCE